MSAATEHLSHAGRFLRREVLSEQSATHFWEQRFLPRWLPLILALPLGVAITILVASDLTYVAITVALLAPVTVLLLRYPFAVVLILLLVWPFLIEERTSDSQVMYWLLQRAIIPLALVVVILADWFGLRRSRQVRFGAAEMVAVVFLAYGPLNMLVLNDPGPRAPIRFYDIVVVPVCLYMLTRLIAPAEEDLRRLAIVGLCGVLTQVPIAIIGWFWPQVLPPQWVQLAGGRTTGTFRSADAYAIALTFFTILTLQYAVQARRGFLRTLSLSAVAIGFFGMFFTFSRASWLGGLLVLGGLGLMYRRAAPRVLAVVVVVVCAAYFLLSGPLESSGRWLDARLTEGRHLENRIVTYAASVELVERRPAFGWGFGNHDQYAEELKTRVAGVPAALGEDITSHNSYLTIMAEFGLIGLALYMFPTIWCLALTVKVWRRLPSRGFRGRTWLGMLWLAQLQQFAVSNFNDMFTHQFFPTLIWWMVLGLIATVVYPYVGRSTFRRAGGSSR